MRTSKASQTEEPVSVTIKLPADVARRYGATPAQVARHLLGQAAVEGYRSGELSRGQVAKVLDLDWEETEELLAKHQCDRHYDLEDLELDRKNLDKIFGSA